MRADSEQTNECDDAPRVDEVHGLDTSSAVPVAVDDAAVDRTLKTSDSSTSLGVAPLEPATIVRAPFVIDTPVPRWSPLGVAHGSARPAIMRAARISAAPGAPAALAAPVTTDACAAVPRHERTAMPALDRSSGMPRGGRWQALVARASSLRSARWWLRRRKTSRVRPLSRASTAR